MSFVENRFMHQPKGQIQVIFGPMFSGKTTELIRRLKRYQMANHRCLVIKYAKDVRYDTDCGEGVSTHDHQSLPAVPSTCLQAVEKLADPVSVIGIDEGQFFPDIVQFAEDMANAGKIVIVAALDGTYQRLGFGNILNLVPLAEHVIKLTAVCMRCYGEASYTQRLGQETQVELIGGPEKYMAACRECHRKYLRNQDEESRSSCMPSPLCPKSPMKNSNSPPKIHHVSPLITRSGKENISLPQK